MYNWKIWFKVVHVNLLVINWYQKKKHLLVFHPSFYPHLCPSNAPSNSNTQPERHTCTWRMVPDLPWQLQYVQQQLLQVKKKYDWKSIVKVFNSRNELFQFSWELSSSRWFQIPIVSWNRLCLSYKSPHSGSYPILLFLCFTFYCQQKKKMRQRSILPGCVCLLGIVYTCVCWIVPPVLWQALPFSLSWGSWPTRQALTLQKWQNQASANWFIPVICCMFKTKKKKKRKIKSNLQI